MRRNYCLLVLLTLGAVGFAQTSKDNDGILDSVVIQDSPFVEFTPFRFPPSFFLEFPDFSPRFDLFRPVQFADGSEKVEPGQSFFTNSPQWVKDLRRGEIVFFGSLPFTVFFTRTFIGLYRTASHNWDRRYAPWPFASAGAVSMTVNELKLMFTIAASASLVISVVDYLIVRHKQKAEVEE